MRGFFEEERLFVRKVKDSQPGFMVLAPFVTSLDGGGAGQNVAGALDENYLRSGLLVNLGWVPAEHKNDIGTGREPLPVLVSLKILTPPRNTIKFP